MNVNIVMINDFKSVNEVPKNDLSSSGISQNDDFKTSLLKANGSSNDTKSNVKKACDDKSQVVSDNVDETEEITEEQNNAVIIPFILTGQAVQVIPIENVVQLGIPNNLIQSDLSGSINLVNVINTVIDDEAKSTQLIFNDVKTAQNDTAPNVITDANAIVSKLESNNIPVAQTEIKSTANEGANTLIKTDTNTTQTIIVEQDKEISQFINKVLQEVDDIIKVDDKISFIGKNNDLKVVQSSEDSTVNATATDEVEIKTIEVSEKQAAGGKSNTDAQSSDSENENESDKKTEIHVRNERPLTSASINADGKIDFKLAQTQEKQTTPIMQKQNIFDQIVQHAKVAADKNQTELYVQLKPAHLGGLIVSLSMGEKGMIAKIMTGQKDVATLIQTDMMQLQESLKEKGINVVHMDVIYDQMANSTSKNNSNNGEQWSSNTKSGGKMYEVFDDAPMIYDNLSMYDILAEQGGSVEYKA